jgi:hypothetical protein
MNYWLVVTSADNFRHDREVVKFKAPGLPPQEKTPLGQLREELNKEWGRTSRTAHLARRSWLPRPTKSTLASSVHGVHVQFYAKGTAWPTTENSTLLSYLEEGIRPLSPGTDLYVVNNSFVIQLPSGGTFVYASLTGMAPPLIENNIFFAPGILTNQANPVLIANFVGDPLFVDLANFDTTLPQDPPRSMRGRSQDQLTDTRRSPDMNIRAPGLWDTAKYDRGH